jgi:5'-deoxynucleotidase YfbR-like HD superfamily hydrolase
MEHLTKLFRLLEITRSQPQYGYALAGIPKGELSDLAQHHYLVTFIAWQLAVSVKAKGAKVDVQKVLEFSLIHDLGELFGGDIAMPYARANPKARELAKAFEGENQNFLAGFFGDQGQYYKDLSAEIMDAKTDEGIIAKLADYLEVTHYKEYVGKFSDGDIVMAYDAMKKKIEGISDPIAKSELLSFIDSWKNTLAAEKGKEFFEQSKF